MTEVEIREILVQSILTVRKQMNRKHLKDMASFTEDLGFDSMALVALASELEKRFGRSLPLPQWLENQRDKKLTLGSLVDFLYNYINQ
ncbi:MAG: hypothetical protein A2Z91_04840 [Deltaproteobacteria bacterium GWA2_38_16]|nr:MAG: hypothetical protein A2Z91_04840 [Deltaproteobacteria bacterium GWA2_38_16]OGQ03109.1 MAG: hypothetical protein A3D19_03575 [Deltaproteobacteria bacterium RIFCSPHIGHO2_02_FULL_38_15]OGQ33834.1 MAG: hypothetical protein A3A72_08985 [Deltaproteobacteria bacterium RIFCSPLOWO2_01_FULL_38_9]OGQ60836.1 MAG: hypothetical protein A3G92_00590 [Deltaproteobacteria bacterium RIFCSPLOWO2_12_FULL_38_8]HBQ20471.1 hypothetical protein [Deltaproteobacteria bacterium]